LHELHAILLRRVGLALEFGERRVHDALLLLRTVGTGPRHLLLLLIALVVADIDLHLVALDERLPRVRHVPGRVDEPLEKLDAADAPHVAQQRHGHAGTAGART